jgi:hypothetical protein
MEAALTPKFRVTKSSAGLTSLELLLRTKAASAVVTAVNIFLCGLSQLWGSEPSIVLCFFRTTCSTSMRLWLEKVESLLTPPPLVPNKDGSHTANL